MNTERVPLEQMKMAELAKYIDHTTLRADATSGDIIKLCDEAREYGFKAVCIAPLWVPLACIELANTDVEICTVVGFPLGYSATAVKGTEAAQAVSQGATEIDMVIPIGLLKDGQFDKVSEDIAFVVDNTTKENRRALVKVIIECCYLSEVEKEKACLLALQAGAGFVKSSTGFGTGGATIEDIKLMRSIVGDKLGVKAAGGIRSYQDVLDMIRAGANRIGTSNGVAIVKGANK